ncbi:hypothetical protein ACWEWX_53015, partial [Streptomyces asiaticus]
LAEEGLAPLPAAVGLVTGGATDVAGLPDRGRLEAGLRADLVLAEPGRPWPVVAAVLRAASEADSASGPASDSASDSEANSGAHSGGDAA